MYIKLKEIRVFAVLMYEYFEHQPGSIQTQLKSLPTATVSKISYTPSSTGVTLKWRYENFSTVRGCWIFPYLLSQEMQTCYKTKHYLADVIFLNNDLKNTCCSVQMLHHSLWHSQVSDEATTAASVSDTPKH